MSREQEHGLFERVGEPPALRPSKLKDVRPRDLLIRFIAGAVTSICAGAVTLGLGARVGGLLLAFPAILAASLTLIEQDEDAAEAREDARGAVMGGLALAAFAAVAALTLPGLSGPISLLLATAAWVLVAVGGYFMLWR
jgi:uncharacterized membrane protein